MPQAGHPYKQKRNMPTYSLNHVHHEASDVHAAADWYVKLFEATADEPYGRAGATWIRVHIGNVTVTITDREFSDLELGRYQGYDHFGLDTDDFDATMARIEECNVDIWTAPTPCSEYRKFRSTTE